MCCCLKDKRAAWNHSHDVSKRTKNSYIHNLLHVLSQSFVICRHTYTLAYSQTTKSAGWQAAQHRKLSGLVSQTIAAWLPACQCVYGVLISLSLPSKHPARLPLCDGIQCVSSHSSCWSENGCRLTYFCVDSLCDFDNLLNLVILLNLVS